MKFEVVPIEKLKASKYNPPERVTTHIPSLVKNIRKNKQITEYGLLAPIVVAQDYTVIDGHRRLTVMKSLGAEKVPVIRHNSTSSEMFDNMWVDSNKDTDKISGNQWLWRYMHGATVEQKALSRIKCLERWLGLNSATNLFKIILDKGQSANTYQFAMGLYRKYTGHTTMPHMKKVAYYLLYVDSAYRMKASITAFIPVELLVDSVMNRKPIITDWQVAS